MSRRTHNDPLVRLSKALSWLLRHGAEKEGFQFLPGGYLFVDSVLQKPQFSKYTLEDVQAVVANNNKQRFHLETDVESGRLKIRANQGHSLQVSDLELEPLTSADEYPVVVHGTYYKFWDSICHQGLKRMNRTHIHFAPGEPSDSGVISGMRGSCDVVVYLDLEKALKGGLKFFRSANNVILCEGNEDGVIMPHFFQKTVDRKTGKVIDGPIMRKAPSSEQQESSDVMSAACAASSATVSAEDLADEMDSQKKHRRKKKSQI